MKANFLIIGAQKAGTSAVDVYLRKHPEVQMAKVKEVHYFDNESAFAGRPNHAMYHRFFEPKQGVLHGEATPIYIYWQDAMRRIWEYNRDIRLIAILRNPIERAYSHWNMERDRGADSLSFSQAIRQEVERCREALPLQHRVYSYVDRGFYSEQLRRVWRFFPKEQVLVLKYDDLRNHPADTLGRIHKFLGLTESRDLSMDDVHSRAYTDSIHSEDRAYLREIYYYEIKNLEMMLGWDCSDWLS